MTTLGAVEVGEMEVTGGGVVSEMCEAAVFLTSCERGSPVDRGGIGKPRADEVEDDEALFSISELMILLITNSC
jgi:hypothetical protein